MVTALGSAEVRADLAAAQGTSVAVLERVLATLRLVWLLAPLALLVAVVACTKCQVGEACTAPPRSSEGHVTEVLTCGRS